MSMLDMVMQRRIRVPRASTRIRDPRILTVRSPINIQTNDMCAEDLTQTLVSPVLAASVSMSTYALYLVDSEEVVPESSISSGSYNL